MAKVPLYNTEGSKSGELDLNDAIFGVTPKTTLVHQVYTAMRANARQPWAHAKDRSEVRGGGRKPWRQKGTGRARHGSRRSPIWAGGGVTFGPLKGRNFKQRINIKMNRLAVKMSLSSKISDGKLIAVESLKSDGKTKAFSQFLSKLPGFGYTTLVIAPEKDEKLLLSARNVEKVDVVRAEDVNVVDLLHHKYVVASKDAVSVLEKRLAK